MSLKACATDLYPILLPGNCRHKFILDYLNIRITQSSKAEALY